jgi:hypothetical protein
MEQDQQGKAPAPDVAQEIAPGKVADAALAVTEGVLGLDAVLTV